jgi:CoA:oxalate CoA-transferase
VSLPGHDRPLAVMGPGFATEPMPEPRVPILGADTEAVLRELGYAAEDIAAMQAEGAVA